ncbi:uncharacterized protein [Haliotis asinina]|uniref:uncharacterized protein n=1 Tax=Haliotis asinina TaxID=109174 RepID=UPI003531E8F2
MGMPGSETYLEELMCRVLGTLIQEGCVAKLADVLVCGGNSLDQVLYNWRRVLCVLRENNLRLSATKTVICTKSTTILGWIWSSGTLTASKHRIAALSSVPPPPTVQGLRSFVGAYKALSRVLHGYEDLLQPLEKATAGKQSKDKICWTDDLHCAFNKAKATLSDNKTITIPRPSDTLCIVTDASSKNHGIAGTLYACRDTKPLLAGFINAKLKTHQVPWLPCELEALAIGSSVKHFSPFITASTQKAQVLTDSRPCVQAYNKLTRGEFSASSRVTTFLSTVTRYNVSVNHISGVNNIPTNYCSRHPSSCSDQSCQVCKFIQEDAESAIRSLSVKDVVEGGARMPFTNRVAWQAAQHECSDLRRAHSHHYQGTRPSKKHTDVPDVKQYLREVCIASDGLLVVRASQPFQSVRERIVVPRAVLGGLLTALHIRFNHPSAFQTRQLFNRYFFALDLDKCLKAVDSSCHHCVSLRSVPNQFYPQSSSPPPVSVGTTFAADVMKRFGQLVFVLRETVSSFTITCFIDSERRDDLRSCIISLCACVRHLGDSGTTIRVDPAPGFVSLANDSILRTYAIHLEIGSPKNVNKNPVGERAIEELGMECLHLRPEGGPLSSIDLALATGCLNSRIRKGGLSSREVFTQRDQLTGEQLPIIDRQLILQQNLARTMNHPHSSKSKAQGKTHLDATTFQVGEQVFLKGERQKTHARDKYLVTGVSEDKCQLRKFVRSQFRSKLYTVRPSDCYHVKPTISSPTGPVRGIEREYPTGENSQPLPNLPTLNSDIDSNCHNEQLCDTEVHEDEPSIAVEPTQQPENTAPDDNTPLRMSSRPRRAPAWQTSGDWIMS